MITILNFSHPLTSEQFNDIKVAIESDMINVVQVPVQLDVNQPFRPQINKLFENISLDKDETAYFVIPPSLNFAAVLVHERLVKELGYVRYIRIKPVNTGVNMVYKFAELL